MSVDSYEFAELKNFVYTDDKGQKIQPIGISVVEVMPYRIAQGFQSDVTIAIYPRLEPAFMLCFKWRDHYMHALIRLSSADSVLNMMRNLIYSPEQATIYLESALVYFWDKMTPGERIILMKQITDEDRANAC